MEERRLNLRDLNLKHINGEIYEYEGIDINMGGCGRTHLQKMTHISQYLAKKVKELEVELAGEEDKSYWSDEQYL